MRPGASPAPRATTLGVVAGAAALGWPAVALAHTAGRAYVLLLPTPLYIAGGALAVAASFAVLALVSPGWLARAAASGWRVATVRVATIDRLSTVASLLSLGVVVGLVAAGLTGSRDPLDNPLPPTVWAVWWIGFTCLHAVAGNVWALVNPWRGLHRLATGTRTTSAGGEAVRAAGPTRGDASAPGDRRGARRRRREGPLLPYPARAASWPAVILFLGFAWFELVHPSPADPVVLARVVAAYVLLHFVGLVLFGPVWLERAEPFGLFFRMVSWLAPLQLPDPEPERSPAPRSQDSPGGSPPGEDRGRAPGPGHGLPGDRGGRCRAVEVQWPAAQLLRAELPDASRTVFVLLALSCVSFDGFSRSFTWLAALGVNPLEYPGRTALVVPDTLGLLGVLATFVLAYGAAMGLTARLSGPGASGPRLARLFALSLVPIVCGYHLAHYLPVLLVDSQHALVAASDPFDRGWNLLGTGHVTVVTSFLTDAHRVYAIWHAQVALIVGAHVMAVLVAHALTRRAGAVTTALRSGLPLLALMIGYTILGLWLLSTPTAS